MQYRPRGSVKALLAEKGISRTELSLACGVSTSHITNILNGATRPSTRLAVAIADALAARPELLFPDLMVEAEAAEA